LGAAADTGSVEGDQAAGLAEVAVWEAAGSVEGG
jgi:hypothetical protein